MQYILYLASQWEQDTTSRQYLIIHCFIVGVGYYRQYLIPCFIVGVQDSTGSTLLHNGSKKLQVVPHTFLHSGRRIPQVALRIFSVLVAGLPLLSILFFRYRISPCRIRKGIMRSCICCISQPTLAGKCRCRCTVQHVCTRSTSQVLNSSVNL